ncbi:interferon lambda-3-like [Prionailurus iriomotensis]
MWERPVALEAELALTLKVLGTVANGSQGDILHQPLHTLGHIHSELWARVSTRGTQAVSALRPPERPPLSWVLPHMSPSSAPSRPPDPRPPPPLASLAPQGPEEVKSLSCLEASVMFNLFYLLIWDLKGVTSEDPCV